MEYFFFASFKESSGFANLKSTKFEIRLTKRRLIIFSKSFLFSFKWCCSHRFQFGWSGMWPRNTHLTNMPGDSALEYSIQLYPIGSLFFLIFSIIFPFLFLSLSPLPFPYLSFLGPILFLYFCFFYLGMGRDGEDSRGSRGKWKKKILPIPLTSSHVQKQYEVSCILCAALTVVHRSFHLIFYSRG